MLSSRIIEVNGATDVTYGYNNDGLRTSVTDPSGTVSFDFDELHRPTRKRYNGTVTASYGYDAPQSVNGVGRLITENDGDFGSGADHCDYTYDPMGRLLSANRTISSTAYSISHTYDLAGNLASLGYPSGRLVQYDFTGGQLNKITDATNAQAPFDYVSSAIYAPLGILQQANLGNNVVTAFAWNNRGQLASILTQKTAGPSYLSLGYSYLTNGQIQQITNNLNTNKTEKYTYDDLGRLLTAQLGPDAAMVRKYQYDYDRYGNRWGQNVVAGSGYNGQLAFDLMSNRVNFGGFSFDASGNLTTNATGTTFAFNQESFLTGAGTASYKIDAQGRRVRKINGAAVTDYFYNGSDLLAEKTGSQWTEYIFFGDQRIAQQSANSAATATYLHVDHLGSTLLSTDGNGNSNGTCDYEPFGEIQVGSTCAVPTNFRYAGMQWDSESSLFHTWFRQYDPAQGRWMGVDPLPGTKGSSQSMDRYIYATNDPPNRKDPTGLLDDFIQGQVWKCSMDGIPGSCNSVLPWLGHEAVVRVDKRPTGRDWKLPGLADTELLEAGCVVNVSHILPVGDMVWCPGWHAEVFTWGEGTRFRISNQDDPRSIVRHEAYVLPSISAAPRTPPMTIGNARALCTIAATNASNGLGGSVGNPLQSVSQGYGVYTAAPYTPKLGDESVVGNATAGGGAFMAMAATYVGIYRSCMASLGF